MLVIIDLESNTLLHFFSFLSFFLLYKLFICISLTKHCKTMECRTIGAWRVSGRLMVIMSKCVETLSNLFCRCWAEGFSSYRASRTTQLRVARMTVVLAWRCWGGAHTHTDTLRGHARVPWCEQLVVGNVFTGKRRVSAQLLVLSHKV